LDIYQDGGQNSGYGKGEQEPENIKVDEAEATELWGIREVLSEAEIETAR